MKIYCEGSHCSKRDSCAIHCVEEGEYQYIDYSTYGGGSSWADENSINHIKTWSSCGDDGNYKLYKNI